GELLAEGRKRQRLAGDAADAAAYQEVLVEHGHGTERSVGILEDFLQHGVEGGLARGGIDRRRGIGPGRVRTRLAQLREDVGGGAGGGRRRGAARRGLRRLVGEDQFAGHFGGGFRQRQQPRAG